MNLPAFETSNVRWFANIDKWLERTGYSTHTTYLIDRIQFQSFSKALDKAKIAELHTKNGLSAAQIAKQLGCSKTLIITTLKRLGVLQKKCGAQTRGKNYRNATPPYGFLVVDGKLASHPAEMKICRLIVDLVERRGLTCVEAARALEAKGLKGRNGLVKWHNYTVSRIFARWKGKL